MMKVRNISGSKCEHCGSVLDCFVDMDGGRIRVSCPKCKSFSNVTRSAGASPSGLKSYDPAVDGFDVPPEKRRFLGGD